MADHEQLPWDYYEELVRDVLQTLGEGLDSFEVHHRKKLDGLDGQYEVDVTASFMALDVRFEVLCECKNWRSPVQRRDIQILHARLQSTGAHKGILFSTSGFQAGAVEYARAHKIGLIRATPHGAQWRVGRNPGGGGGMSDYDVVNTLP